jgi:hypothetical protein
VTVTIDTIANALGREAPEAETPEAPQWVMWIGDALMLIEAHFGSDIFAEIVPARLDYVVREAVVSHVRRPDDATSVEVAVDDGREARRYSTGKGRVFIRDEWWDLLDPNASAIGGAFSVDTATITAPLHADICSLNFGATYCSCGAILTLALPLYENQPGTW